MTLHGRATGVHGRAPRAETCPTTQTGARAAVRLTHSRAWVHGHLCAYALAVMRPALGLRIFSRFSSFLFAVFLHFWRTLPRLLLGEL